MSSIAVWRGRHARSAALAALCAILFLTFLDNTIVSVALAGIQTSLRVSVTGLQWIVDGYMLAFAVLMLTGGTLGDILGRKKVMLAGVAIFCAGSVVAALATTSSMLIAGRIVMGVGAAASEPGTLSLIRQIYPEPAPRARALGIWAAVSGVALSLGPVIGGVLIGGDSTQPRWTWIFWFGVAVAAVCFVGAALLLTESRDPVGRKLDLPGLAVGGSAILAATFAVIEGENRGYGTWWIVALFALAVVLVGAFVAVEGRVSDPVLKLEFLRDPTFVAANVVAFATNLAVFSVFFFTALYLQLIAGFDGFHIALAFAALAAAMIVGGPIAGRWTARVGPREPLVVGCALAGVGLLLVDWKLTVGTTVLALSWPLAVAGLGFGIAMVSMTQAVLTLFPAEESGAAASTVNTSRELGGVVGVAIFGAIVNAQLTGGLAHKLAELHLPPVIRQIVIQIFTTGGSTNPADYQQAAGHGKDVALVFAAAADYAGRGIHLALEIGGGMVLSAAVVAVFAARHRVPSKS